VDREAQKGKMAPLVSLLHKKERKGERAVH